MIKYDSIGKNIIEEKLTPVPASCKDTYRYGASEGAAKPAPDRRGWPV